MGYRYDRPWYDERAEIVKALLDVIEKGDVLVIQRKDHSMITRLQYEYNNILAAAHIFEPELRLRERCRTWMRREGDEWMLFIGQPTHRIRGRPVAEVIRPDALAQRIVPLAQTPDEAGAVLMDKGYDDKHVPMLILDLMRASDMGARRIKVTNLSIASFESLLGPSLSKLKTDYGWSATNLEETDGLLRSFELVKEGSNV